MARALEGIKVVDFSWVLAGPALTRYLADYGAEVVLVESAVHPDIMRTSPPYRDGQPGLNRSTLWADFHADKYGLALNMNIPEGIDVARRLISRGDIVVENFIPGTLDKWGLGYNELVKLKPDIILVSISLYGQTGPYARRGGWGSFAEGMSGFWNLIGWGDRGPSSYQSVIGDALVPFFGLSAVMAALDCRKKTG
ncbi:MAG: CoA transferase [Chloroflexi bacterium]|nr:CoA transferase [Chloroflexota bacterium]